MNRTYTIITKTYEDGHKSFHAMMNGDELRDSYKDGGYFNRDAAATCIRKHEKHMRSVTVIDQQVQAFSI